MVGDIDESIKGGALTGCRPAAGQRASAGRQGAAARSARKSLKQTKIRFLQVVGEPITNAQTPPSVAKFLPKTLNDAVFVAGKNSPRIYSANADINAADAGVRGARANYMPKVNLEGTARVGNDIDGDEGNTNDYQVRVVARWNLYRGGIDVAREQEQIRRADEQRYALAQVQREVEQSVRSAWNERVSRGDAFRYPQQAGRDQQPARRLLP